MSTFKTQPVYAELLMGWLDAATLDVAGIDYREVLESTAWTFKGGKLGDYPMRFPTESSEDTYPSGPTATLCCAEDDDTQLAALQRVSRRRVRDKRMRARGCADWACSYYVARSIRAMSETDAQVETGLRAVYRVVRDIWRNCFAPRSGAGAARSSTFIREVTLASATASHLDVPTTSDIISATTAALVSTRMTALQHSHSAFCAALRYSGSPTARQASVMRGRAVIADPGAYIDATITEMGTQRHSVSGRTYFVGHGFMASVVGGTPVMLSRSDIVRVHQFLTGACSGLFATVSQACTAPGPERSRASEIGNAYEAQVSRILEHVLLVPQGDEVMVCKAYKRAFGAYLGELSGPLCAAETRELWAETHATRWADRLDVDGWVAAIRGWSASTAFNLGKVYKLCPAPDASPGLTMVERHEMVCNHNVPDPAILADFESELRSQILRSYIRQPGVRLELRSVARKPSWWGSYRSGQLDEVPSAEIHEYLQWEGTAKMPARSPDNPAVWKDSGLGWDTEEIANDPERNRKHGNMLMRMVFDSAAPMPGVRHSGHESVHKVDIKPEGHKDPARGIYSGNLRDRLNQSWMEAAVQEVASAHPAFMIGADAETRDARIRAIVERVHDPDHVCLYYSFDVSGWSPRMPPEVQHISHAIWALLYGEPLFRAASQITDGSRVYMNKNGVQGWYVNPGTNFEGYNGKEMTMLLITLMSLAVKRWRAALVHSGSATPLETSKWSAILLAYIDDGLAKLTLPRDRAEQLFEQFKATSEETFRMCGFTIERSKCYPSDRFAIFLNEPYLAGRHVTHGTRAAMTICAENVEEHTSLIERLTAVSTGCRGAVMSGLDATAGVMLQAYHVFSHLNEWVSRPDPVASAVWACLPRAWGGLGLPTALQLGTSGGGAAFEESVRSMQTWAQISTPARLAFLRRARGPLVERTTTGILLSPLGGRVSDGNMVETRVPDAVRLALTQLRADGALSRLALDFLGYASPESLDAYSEAVVPGGDGTVIQEQLLMDLAAAHPHAIFSAFARRIEKSTTLMQLVGQRVLRRIIRANRSDAASSYACVRNLLTV